jgi:hypothetical protein
VWRVHQIHQCPKGTLYAEQGPVSSVRSCCFPTTLIALIVFFACAISTAAGQNVKGQDPIGIHLLKHRLMVKPDFEAGALEATSVLTIANASGKEVKTISAILHHMLEVTAANTSDGKALRYTQEVVPMADDKATRVRHVQVALDEPLLPGVSISLEIKYQGRLAGYEDAGRAYLKDRVGREFTIIRLDCFAYPLVCSPSMADFVKSVLWDLGHGWDYLLEVTVPEQYVVANGGKLLGRNHENGTITYTYANMKPAWRIDACIAKYDVLENDDASAKVFFLSGNKVDAQRSLDALMRSMDCYSEWFGPLAGIDGFSIIEVPDGYGSQADVTSILQESKAFKGEMHMLYHEVSHLWNPPTLDANPSRFESEGLACFLEYLLVEKLDNTPGYLEKGLKQRRNGFRAQCRSKPDLKDISVAEYGVRDCTEASYTKGPIAFWLLYEIVGEGAFFDSYKRFRQDCGDKGGTLADFMATVKSVSGMDLQRFADEWIYGTRSSEYLLSDMSLQQVLEVYAAESGDSTESRR